MRRRRPRRARAAAGGGVAIGADDVLAALERATVRGDAAGEPGRVAVLDLARVRTRQVRRRLRDRARAGDAAAPRADVSVLRRRHAARARRERGARLQRPDAASRDRYLFYTACTRPRRLLTLVREAATDDGSPREPSPFWEAVCELFDPDDVRRHTTRRPLARLTWPIEAAPTERERLRALARLAADEPREADALAFANGWQRKLGRARRAFSRPTAIRIRARSRCSAAARRSGSPTSSGWPAARSAWFVERYLRPGGIDQAIDPRMRGSIAHVALQRFYSAAAGRDARRRARHAGERRGGRRAHARDASTSALETGLRIDADDLQRRELGQGLQRDLEQLVRAEAAAGVDLRPARAGGQRSRATSSLRASLVSGKIDRVDADPVSARGIIVDYKSGAAPSASQIHDEARLQIPLYLLVLRDQLGLEPMGGVYMPLGGGRRARGMLRAGDERVPGFATGDYLDDAGVRGRDRARARDRGRAGGADPRRRRPSTTRTAATARPGATSGGCAGRSGRERGCPASAGRRG